MDNDPDFNGMLLDQVKILLDLLLTQLICPLGAILGEGLLLGLVPGGRKYLYAPAGLRKTNNGSGLDEPERTPSWPKPEEGVYVATSTVNY